VRIISLGQRFAQNSGTVPLRGACCAHWREGFFCGLVAWRLPGVVQVGWLRSNWIAAPRRPPAKLAQQHLSGERGPH
jgi:hypothetical protein